ncbi:TetR/AcrR family transcriptional regulator [Microbacterium sp. No. 7]|uniref:TetR/AcrR family transcriptional regulator n=1 Tax=Microbacterium sp. No. 7 TaxID=1714373 RepID=UPI0006CF785F|nr:TetR family transcriptional regulator [Microbacterium sp. No. 7]ALJ19791.1 hypothetical protein AOA12_07675 [Microbacterium sp. No. 7]
MDENENSDRPRRPGRPRLDGPVPPVTRASIAEAALGLAADRGFPALTMRSLAERLGVTVRALYNHVADRQDVVDLVAARIMELHPQRRLDAADRETSVRALYHDTREAYRRMGRALLFSLDETVTPVEVPPERVLLPERLLAFLTDVGLSLPDALAWRAQFLGDVFGFALMIDHRYDRADARERRSMQDPVPRGWLDAHPEIDAPRSRAAADLPDSTSDELFERLVDRAVLSLDALAARRARQG